MNYIKTYADFLKKFLKLKTLVKVVFDCSNGAVVPVLKELMDIKNLEVVVINDEIDGDFPAHGPNPLAQGATDDLARMIVESKADFGVVFDSDGDRAVFLDELGKEINPHNIFLCLKEYFEPPYVLNVNALKDFTMPTVEVVEEKVGRFNIINTMREKRAGFGVEHSSHYYFKDFYYSDAGILASLFLANYISEIKNKKFTLSRAVGEFNKFEWPNETNFEVEDGEGAIRRIEENYENSPGIKIRKLDGISVFGPDFAFNVRTSNTEPLVRLNIAAKNKKTFEDKLTEVKKIMGVDEVSAS